MSVRSDELKAMVDDAWAATETLSGCEPDVRQVAFERLLTHLLSGDRGGAPAAGGGSNQTGYRELPPSRWIALTPLKSSEPGRLRSSSRSGLTRFGTFLTWATQNRSCKSAARS